MRQSAGRMFSSSASEHKRQNAATIAFADSESSFLFGLEIVATRTNARNVSADQFSVGAWYTRPFQPDHATTRLHCTTVTLAVNVYPPCHSIAYTLNGHA